MNYNVKVSIITPVFNGEKTIRDTIESILNQSYTNIEYIIIDGKSTDGTLKIIGEYESVFKGRLKVISEKDNGIYNAINKGIRFASGKIIGIINSDDYYQEDTVKKIVTNMEKYPYQVLYGYLRVIDRENLYRVTKVKHSSGKMIPHPTCFVTRSIYKKYGMFNENYKIAADYEFMMRLYKKRDIHFIQIKEVLANFRVGGISHSQLAYLETNFAKFMHGKTSLKQLWLSLIEYMIVRCIDEN